MISTSKMSLNITFLKLLPQLPGANELTNDIVKSPNPKILQGANFLEYGKIIRPTWNFTQK